MLIDPRERRKAREADGKPAEPTLGNETKRINRECRIPGAVVGWEHYNSAVKGTRGLLVRFVALDEPDAGAICERTFWLTDAAIDQFLDFLLACGHNEPLDPENNDHLEVAFSHGAVMMDVKGEEWTTREGDTKTSYRPAWFGAFKGKGKAAWNAILASAEKQWASYVEWRANNPRPEPGASGGGGGYTEQSKPKSSRFGGADEEIPFAMLLAAGASSYIAAAAMMAHGLV